MIAAILLLPVLFLTVLALEYGRLLTIRGELQRTADAAALAGGVDLLEGANTGAAAAYVGKNLVLGDSAAIDTAQVDTETGAARVVVRYNSGPLLLASDGFTLRARASARVQLADSGGRPVPPGNAFGWYKNNKKTKGAGRDSARVLLVQ